MSEKIMVMELGENKTVRLGEMGNMGHVHPVQPARSLVTDLSFIVESISWCPCRVEASTTATQLLQGRANRKANKKASKLERKNTTNENYR